MDVNERQRLNAAINALGNLDDGDPEAAHSEAEDILCRLLTDFNLNGAVIAFEEARDRVGFWYA